MLVNILNAVQAMIMWPTVLMHILITMQGKPSGGKRPVALMPYIPRLVERTHKGGCRQWTAAQAAFAATPSVARRL